MPCCERLHQLDICSTEIQWVHLSDHVQRIKCNYSYFGWGLVLEGIPKESFLGPLLFLIYVNDMLLIQNGSLLQFAGDTCLICYGGDHTQVKDFLSSDCMIYIPWLDGLLQVRCRLMWKNLV